MTILWQWSVYTAEDRFFHFGKRFWGEAVAFFIAEVSSNHSKSLDRALEFIEVAADVGCDAVKFQLFRIDKLFAPEILTKSKRHRGRAEWELPLDFLPALSEKCRQRGVKFGCTPFYIEAVTELEPFVDFYKVASYELLWADMLAACAKTGKPVIVSTGMATVEEVDVAVQTLRESGCSAPTLLECTSSYPSPVEEANLGAILYLRERYGCDTGWSDHTVEPGVINRAVNKWDAKVVEFHLDLDGQGEEFASGHCWLPDDISKVISDVRKGSLADGDAVKRPKPSEFTERDWRADPHDGLRPLMSVRGSFQG